jgi:hypothetical protein
MPQKSAISLKPFLSELVMMKMTMVMEIYSEKNARRSLQGALLDGYE